MEASSQHPGFGSLEEGWGAGVEAGKGDSVLKGGHELSDVSSSFIIAPFFPDSQQSTSCCHLSWQEPPLSHLFLPLPLALSSPQHLKTNKRGSDRVPSCLPNLQPLPSHQSLLTVATGPCAPCPLLLPAPPLAWFQTQPPPWLPGDPTSVLHLRPLHWLFPLPKCSSLDDHTVNSLLSFWSLLKSHSSEETTPPSLSSQSLSTGSSAWAKARLTT